MPFPSVVQDRGALRIHGGSRLFWRGATSRLWRDTKGPVNSSEDTFLATIDSTHLNHHVQSQVFKHRFASLGILYLLYCMIHLGGNASHEWHFKLKKGTTYYQDKVRRIILGGEAIFSCRFFIPVVREEENENLSIQTLFED